MDNDENERLIKEEEREEEEDEKKNLQRSEEYSVPDSETFKDVSNAISDSVIDVGSALSHTYCTDARGVDKESDHADLGVPNESIGNRLTNDEKTRLPAKDGSLNNIIGSINDPEVDSSGNSRTGDADDVTTVTPSRPKLTLRQKLTFVGIAVTYLSSFMSMSILAPFFPYESKKKGVNATETGFVFGVFALVSFFASLFFGKYLPVIGGKFLFLGGSFVAAGCNVLFGVLNEIESKVTFLVYCYLIRTVEALGSAACLTAGMAIVANVYPDNVAQVTGILEIFNGFGFAVGPPVGSLLYGIGGYQLPFLVLGGTAIVVATINIFVLPSVSSTDGNEPTGSLLSVMRIPAVWVTCIACGWNAACQGFSDPTLALHLTGEDFKVKPGMVGVLFLIIGVVYGATAPFLGYLADKTKATRFMMAIGFWLSGASFMLLGPSPLLDLPNKLWIIIFSLALFGFSIGVALMPVFLDLLLSAKRYGLPDDMSTQSIVSGMFNGFYYMGSFLGPTVAGVLVDNLGFDWSATIFAGGNFIVMIIICLFSAWEFRCGKSR